MEENGSLIRSLCNESWERAVNASVMLNRRAHRLLHYLAANWGNKRNVRMFVPYIAYLDSTYLVQNLDFTL